MKIHRLAPAEAGRYRALMLEAYRAHPQSFTTTASEREPLPLSWWQARVSDAEDATTQVYGIFDAQGELHGVVGLSRKKQLKTRHKVTLFGLYVVPPFRKQGFARQLVEHALSEARLINHARLIQLSVSETNTAAVALYQHYGFEQYAREPFAIALEGEYLTKLHMWRMLD